MDMRNLKERERKAKKLIEYKKRTLNGFVKIILNISHLNQTFEYVIITTA
jgi:hypothetical protein